MPRFWRSLYGPRVTVSPQVISGPASPGQQVWIGNMARSTSSASINTSWQGALFTTLAGMLSTCLKVGSFSHRSLKPFGGSGSFRYASSRPMSRKAATDSAPIPRATRSGVPNRLPCTGIVWPLGFSNSSAGPLARRVRSQISVISRCGSICWVMRLSSPRASSWARKSRRSEYFIKSDTRYKKETRGPRLDRNRARSMPQFLVSCILYLVSCHLYLPFLYLPFYDFGACVSTKDRSEEHTSELQS